MIKGYEDLPEDVKKYVPNYEYLVYDFSNYTDQEIKGEAQLRIIFSLFRDIFTKDGKTFKATALRAIEHLNELEDRQTEFHATFLLNIIDILRCKGAFASAKFEYGYLKLDFIQQKNQFIKIFYIKKGFFYLYSEIYNSTILLLEERRFHLCLILE